MNKARRTMLQASAAAVAGLVLPAPVQARVQAREPLLGYYGKEVGEWLEIISNVREDNYNGTGTYKTVKIGFVWMNKEYAERIWTWCGSGEGYRCYLLWGRVLAIQEYVSLWKNPETSFQRLNDSNWELTKEK